MWRGGELCDEVVVQNHGWYWVAEGGERVVQLGWFGEDGQRGVKPPVLLKKVLGLLWWAGKRTRPKKNIKGVGCLE